MTLLSPFHTGAPREQFPGTCRGTTILQNLHRVGLPRGTPSWSSALSSTAWCPLALHKAPGAAQGWSGQQRRLCKAGTALCTQPDPYLPFSSTEEAGKKIKT